MTEQPIKTKHHYVPVCYLREFTPSGAKDAPIRVTDLDTGERWTSRPAKSGCENDYNSVEGDLRSDAIEDVFSQIESSSAPIWKRMIESGKVPSDPHELNWMMNFLALLQARTKPNRRALHQMHVSVYNKITDLITATPERFEGQIRKMKGDGVDIPELPEGTTLEDVRRKIRDGSIFLDANIHNNYYIEKMMEHIDLMLHLFHDRHWSVCDLSSTGVQLITSDDPVSNVWTIPMPPIHPPGFGMTKTMVVVPLNTRKVLLGAFDPKDLEIQPSRELALRLNHVTLGRAFRFVYSADEDISFIDAEEASGDTLDLDTFISERLKEHGKSDEKKYVHEFGPLIILSPSREPNSILL